MYLDPVFGFLFGYEPIVAVTIFSIIVLIIINIFYKILVNQSEARQSKEKSRELNKEMKALQKEGKRDEANKMLGDVMRENSRLMRMALKPMLISFIIVIVLLPWVGDTYGDRLVTLQDGAGSFNFLGTDYQVTKTDGVISFDGKSCTSPCTETLNGMVFEVVDEGDKIKFAPVLAALPVSFPWIGNSLGWIGWYVLVSIPIVMLTRKLMKIYV